MVYIYNYHRIGRVDSDNPFHLLHTIDENVFYKQIKFMKFVGRIIAIEDLLTNKLLNGNNFVIAFDDVSSTIKNISPFSSTTKYRLPTGSGLLLKSLVQNMPAKNNQPTENKNPSVSHTEVAMRFGPLM